MNKKQLEIKIQQIPPHPNPKVELEQYSTPASVAADILWNALTLGDIDNKNILDLGCGCGIFAISSLILNAKLVVGVDIDKESIEVAEAFSDNFNNCRFIVSDINDFDEDLDVDTIFQNPPFGSQRNATKGIDLKFIKKAISFNPKAIYSFHMASTEEFIKNYFLESGLDITHIFRYDFKIPKIYDFHSKESKNVDVIVIRAISDF